MSARLLPAGTWSPRRRLREALAEGEPVFAPGAYDALSARLVAEAGFPAVYMTGFGAAASLLGRPDVGLLTMTEMVDQARRMVDAVDVPVIADADTGYGNPLNVVRTVRAYEQAGVAALHLEDQVAPKRCGHIEGKQVVSADDMVAKLRAAVAARTDPNLVLIARTDALAVEGIDAAVDRARRYHEAGADVLFVEAPGSEVEVETVAHQLAGVPLLFNWVEGGRTPPPPVDRLRELGFRIVIFPVSALLAVTKALREFLHALNEAGSPESIQDRVTSFGDFLDFIGLSEVRELESRFSS